MTRLGAVHRVSLVLALGLALTACSADAPPQSSGSPAAPTVAAPPATTGDPTPGATTGPRTPDAAPGTLFGAAYRVTKREPEDVALARTDELLGRLDVVRVFNEGFPAPWPGKAPGRNVVVSFKLEPAQVIQGVHDQAMARWFRDAPDDVEVHWSYWHEPEDDIEAGRFTADQYKVAFAHLQRIARDAAGPRLRSTLILQSYTTRPQSGRDWRDYYPGDEAVDVFAWDVYNRPPRAGGYTPPAELMGAQVEAARSVGKPFAVAELGSVLAEGDDGSGRARWLREAGDYLKAQDAVFVTYFDLAFNGGRDDYRLRDAASIQAWKDVAGQPS